MLQSVKGQVMLRGRCRMTVRHRKDRQTRQNNQRALKEVNVQVQHRTFFMHLATTSVKLLSTNNMECIKTKWFITINPCTVTIFTNAFSLQVQRVTVVEQRATQLSPR